MKQVALALNLAEIPTLESCARRRRDTAEEVRLVSAKVEAVDAASIRVRTDDEVLVARRATSCLVVPLMGDRVLVAIEPAGLAFVTAVLGRPSNEPVALGTDGSSLRISVETLELEANAMKLVAQQLDVVAARSVERVDRAYRFVSGFEHVRATRIDWRATQTMSLRGENTLVTAEKLVKLDGEQIHVG